MKPPSTALLRAFSPIYSQTLPWAARGCLAQQAQPKASFSSTEQRQKRNKGQQKRDPRISMSNLPPRMTRGIDMLRKFQSSSATISNTASLPALYASPGISFPFPPPSTPVSSNAHTVPATSATGPSTAPGNSTNARSNTPKNRPLSANTTACAMPAKPYAS